MRVGLDATPLLGRATGVGTYVRGLLEGLTSLSGPELVGVPFTARGGRRPDELPASVRWRHVPAPARLLQAAWQVGSFPPVELLAGRVDVFHATNFVAPPAARAASVITLHDLAFARSPQWVSPAVLRYRRLVPRALRRSGTVVVTPSAAVAAEVAEEYGLPDDRIVVTPLGVGAAWARAAPADDGWLARRGLPTDFLLFTGAREPRKNLGTLVEAHRRARAASAVADLVLVGPPGWGPGLAAAEGVHVAGWLSPDELRRLVARARASVLPSHYEGFGLPVLEAMAAGTRVLASDIPAHRETAGGHAVLVAPTDVDGWARELAAAAPLPPPERAAATAWAAGHTWARCAAATLTAYERAVG